jgi:hypothetical protein
MRRDPGRERDWDRGGVAADVSNVTPLRPSTARGAEGAPAAQQSTLFDSPAVPLAAEPERTLAQAPLPEEPAALDLASAEDFMSPFEDEMDVPAFLRRGRERARRPAEDEDIEAPAFLRRSAD